MDLLYLTYQWHEQVRLLFNGIIDVFYSLEMKSVNKYTSDYNFDKYGYPHLYSFKIWIQVKISFHVHKTSIYTTTKPFVPSIWGRLHEPKKNYAGSGTWINFLHSFLSSSMPSLRLLASISCHITSIHVFFGLPCDLLTCPKLIRSTRRSGASVGLRCT